MDSQLFSPPSFPLSSLLLLFPFFFFRFDSFQWSVFFFLALLVLTADHCPRSAKSGICAHTARQYLSVDRYFIVYWDLFFVASGPT
jgi:hypothetical protein